MYICGIRGSNNIKLLKIKLKRQVKLKRLRSIQYLLSIAIHHDFLQVGNRGHKVDSKLLISSKYLESHCVQIWRLLVHGEPVLEVTVRRLTIDIVGAHKHPVTLEEQRWSLYSRESINSVKILNANIPNNIARIPINLGAKLKPLISSFQKLSWMLNLTQY